MNTHTVFVTDTQAYWRASETDYGWIIENRVCYIYTQYICIYVWMYGWMVRMPLKRLPAVLFSLKNTAFRAPLVIWIITSGVLEHK